MATGTWVEVEHRDRGHLVLELELIDWVGWETWAGPRRQGRGVPRLRGREAHRHPRRRLPVVEPDAQRLPAVAAGRPAGPYPAGSIGRRRVDVAVATGTAPNDWNNLADLLTAEEAIQEARRRP